MEYSRDKNGLSLSEKFASTKESLQQESLIHDVMQRTMAVSYTHLDVYKRQL